MIDRDHDLPLARQAKVLSLARSTVYYNPRRFRRRTWASCAGSTNCISIIPSRARVLRALLRREGVCVGRRHVASLMKRMGISAICRRPNTSKPAPGHKIYPYLLRGVKIERVIPRTR